MLCGIEPPDATARTLAGPGCAGTALPAGILPEGRLPVGILPLDFPLEGGVAFRGGGTGLPGGPEGGLGLRGLDGSLISNSLVDFVLRS
jgi:hypothetical protein